MEKTYINNGTLKEGAVLSTNRISDVDANGDSAPCISVLGGFFGELVNVISTLESLADQQENEKDPEGPDYSFLSALFGFKNTTFESLIPSLFGGTLDGATIDLCFKRNIDEDLGAIFEGLKMDNIGEENIGRNKKRQARQLIVDTLGSKFTMVMEEHLEELGIREKMLLNVKKAFGTCLVKSLCSPNLTVIYEPETELQAYLKTIPEDEIIPVDSDVDPEPMDEDLENPNPEVPKEPEKTLAERELLDKVTLINPNLEGGRILMYHVPAAVMLRREILVALAENVGNISNHETSLLNKVNENARKIE
jgi:hypothetical protein